jgi:hypothetical protein
VIPIIFFYWVLPNQFNNGSNWSARHIESFGHFTLRLVALSCETLHHLINLIWFSLCIFHQFSSWPVSWYLFKVFPMNQRFIMKWFSICNLSIKIEENLKETKKANFKTHNALIQNAQCQKAQFCCSATSSQYEN